MSDIFENKGALAATIVVAASNSLNKGQANYVCDGVNDHVEIQAALDALLATGGEVKLLDGTYHIEVSLVLDSYQTLTGCGRNTILTTTTANLDIITATGGAGTEKVGLLLADFCIDGNAGGVANDTGILWTFVDDSKIINVWLLDNDEDGIQLVNSDNNIITLNICNGNTRYGINVSDAGSTRNIIQGNDLRNGGAVANFNNIGTLTIVKSDNREIQITDIRDYIYIKNTSGGASAIGDVARHKAVAAGNEYDTPTANGEDSVLGMVAEVIANNASGYVQVGGKTTVLKSTNAGGNIAIGDYLCTEIGVRARLAAAGDMAFARALEACAAADCTIDALIISSMEI